MNKLIRLSPFLLLLLATNAGAQISEVLKDVLKEVGGLNAWVARPVFIQGSSYDENKPLTIRSIRLGYSIKAGPFYFGEKTDEVRTTITTTYRIDTSRPKCEQCIKEVRTLEEKKGQSTLSTQTVLGAETVEKCSVNKCETSISSVPIRAGSFTLNFGYSHIPQYSYKNRTQTFSSTFPIGGYFVMPVVNIPWSEIEPISLAVGTGFSIYSLNKVQATVGASSIRMSSSAVFAPEGFIGFSRDYKYLTIFLDLGAQHLLFNGLSFEGDNLASVKSLFPQEINASNWYAKFGISINTGK